MLVQSTDAAPQDRAVARRFGDGFDITVSLQHELQGGFFRISGKEVKVQTRRPGGGDIQRTVEVLCSCQTLPQMVMGNLSPLRLRNVVAEQQASSSNSSEFASPSLLSIQKSAS